MNKKKIGIILGVVLTMMAAFLVKNYIDVQKPQELINDQNEIAEMEAKAAREDVTLQFQKDKVNILFLGFDKDQGREEYYRLFRPDGIILLSIDFSTDEINLVSFPRDSRVWIAHRPGKDKINASFYYGHDLGQGKTDEERQREGYRYCVDTVSEFLGNIYINNYIAIDMDGLRNIIDEIGGVEITLSEDAYVDWDNGEKFLIAKAGKQTLTGAQFLDYVRDRDHTNEKDVERAQRTQEALVMVYNQMKSQNMLKLFPSLYTSYQNHIDTDLGLKEMASLALYGQKVDFKDISLNTIQGNYEYINDIIYYIPDEKARIDLVKEVFDLDFSPER